MKTNIPEIDNLRWGEPKLVSTFRGKCLVKSADLVNGTPFWNVWRTNKAQLKQAGFSIGKFGAAWQVSWWAKDNKFVAPNLNIETIPEPTVDLIPMPDHAVIKLYDWQRPLADLIYTSMARNNISLNGCGTGIGKTYITLAVAKARGRDLVVICPKPITTDWLAAAETFGVKIHAFGWEWIKTGKTPFGYFDTVMRSKYSKAKNKWIPKEVRTNFNWTIPANTDIVFDEVHRASALDTQNAQLVIKAKELDIPMYLLSATVADSPMKLKAIGYALGLHQDGKHYWVWIQENGCVKTRFGFQFQGTQTHLVNLHRQIFPVKGCRIRPEQLGDRFPRNQTLAKAYATDEMEAITDAYDEMNERIAELEEMELSASETALGILAAIIRARQKVELLKVPLMVNLAGDAAEEGNSVFLAVNFRDTLNELIKALKITSIIAGGQKHEHRREAIDCFQRNDTPFLAGIIQACREGINLHDLHGGHPRLSLIMPTPSANDLRQVLGRVWRAGGLTPSIQRILFAAGTIEEEVCKNLASKLDRLDLLMDGDLQKGIFPNCYSTMRPQDEP